MTRLYLVRHGETPGNQERRYIGWEDPPLAATGEAQAAALAQNLKNVPITAVYSSDLRRAVHTAEILAAPYGLAVQIDPRLREINFGDWSGLTYDEIAALAPEQLQRWVADPVSNPPPRGETLAQLTERVLQALPQEDGALVVTHGGPLRAIVSHFTGRPFWQIPAPHCGLIAVRNDGLCPGP